MKWERDGSSVEIRTQGELSDGKPALDEIVASGATVHLEQMSHDHWWMSLEAAGKYSGRDAFRWRGAPLVYRGGSAALCFKRINTPTSTNPKTPKAINVATTFKTRAV